VAVGGLFLHASDAASEFVTSAEFIAEHPSDLADARRSRGRRTTPAGGSLGTVKKSTATICPRWFCRKVLHVCDGIRFTVRRTRETVRSGTAIPSFRSAPYSHLTHHIAE